MRPPPPVSARLPDDPVWRVLRSGIPALSGWGLMVWLAVWAEWGFGAHLMAGLLAAGVAAAVDRRKRWPPLDLFWDGTQWWCRPAPEGAKAGPGRSDLMPAGGGGAAACRVQAWVCLDLGAWMLVRIDPVDAKPAPGAVPGSLERLRHGEVGTSGGAPSQNMTPGRPPSSGTPSGGRAGRRPDLGSALKPLHHRCPRWWAVSSRGAGAAWAGLRVALYCAPLGPLPRSDGE